MKIQKEELNVFLENDFNSSIANSYNKKERQVRLTIDSSTFNKILKYIESNQ